MYPDDHFSSYLYLYELFSLGNRRWYSLTFQAETFRNNPMQQIGSNTQNGRVLRFVSLKYKQSFLYRVNYDKYQFKTQQLKLQCLYSVVNHQHSNYDFRIIIGNSVSS